MLDPRKISNPSQPCSSQMVRQLLHPVEAYLSWNVCSRTSTIIHSEPVTLAPTTTTPSAWHATPTPGPNPSQTVPVLLSSRPVLYHVASQMLKIVSRQNLSVSRPFVKVLQECKQRSGRRNTKQCENDHLSWDSNSAGINTDNTRPCRQSHYRNLRAPGGKRDGGREVLVLTANNDKMINALRISLW
ncbi:hypothetical protein RRG08_028712 [Elysia crispata]|uniref:Uncharacterized protein n=1 Tax=Elysia crispata TaxID=231223 RepID=A0AAE0XNP5_9GAST|nr:hypothetical protein RRG08_028712 [Elysia crispata]